jgi:hypothetical protein
MPAAHFQHQRSNQVVRKELQQHLQQHKALMLGYTDYLQRGAAHILALACSKPPGSSGGGGGGSVTAAEMDRLSLLLAPLAEGEAGAAAGGEASPMEIIPTPFAGT